MKSVRWFLSGDKSVASSRYQGYAIHEYLRSRGRDSLLVFAPALPQPELPWTQKQIEAAARALRDTVVVLQKMRGSQAELLVRYLKQTGAATVYIESDLEPSRQHVALTCDAVICPSRQLANHFADKGAKAVWYIPDSPDLGTRIVRHPCHSTNDKNLRLCWIGHPANLRALDSLKSLLQLPEFADFDLVTVTNHPDATVSWSLRNVQRVLREVDIGVVPVGDDERATLKSSNRVVRFMAAGVPVIAADIPSYREVIEHGRTGYLCRTSEDWLRALRELRDPRRRQIIVEKAYETAESFTLPAIAEQYWQAFHSIGIVRSEEVTRLDGEWSWQTWADLQAAAAWPQFRILRRHRGWKQAVSVAVNAAYRANLLSGSGLNGARAAAKVASLFISYGLARRHD